MQAVDDKEGVGLLFASELVDLRREIMTLGLIVPLLILSYFGLIATYQKPFLTTIDMRVPMLCVATLVYSVVMMVKSRNEK